LAQIAPFPSTGALHITHGRRDFFVAIAGGFYFPPTRGVNERESGPEGLFPSISP
jgi:hypothetical protein